MRDQPAKKKRAGKSKALTKRSADDYFEKAKGLHQQAARAMKTTLGLALRCGKALIRARELCEHGEWQKKATAAVGSYETAMRWVRLAENPEIVNAYMKELEDKASIDGALKAIAGQKESEQNGGGGPNTKDEKKDEEITVPSLGGNPFAPGKETLVSIARAQLVADFRKVVWRWPDSSVVMWGLVVEAIDAMASPEFTDLRFTDLITKVDEKLRPVARAIYPPFQEYESGMKGVKEKSEEARRLADELNGRVLEELRKLRKKKTLTPYQTKVVKGIVRGIETATDASSRPNGTRKKKKSKDGEAEARKD